MPLITTSHRPARRTRTLCNDLARVIPDAIRVSRGKMSMYELALKTIELDSRIAIVIDTFRGNPSKVSFLSVTSKGYNFVPPELLLGKVVLRREIEKRRAPARPKLVITHEHQTTSTIGKLANQLANHLNSSVYPGKLRPGLSESGNIALFISKSHNYPAILEFIEIPTLQELGPVLCARRVADTKEGE
ncbi:MAG: Brix domain-containing protein [Promethearchaeota archaeon]